MCRAYVREFHLPERRVYAREHGFVARKRGRAELLFGVIVQPLHEEIFHLRGLVEHLPAAYFLFEQERLAGSLLFRLRFRHAVGRVPGAGLHYALSLGVETMGGVMTKMIDRNTTIPTRKTEIYSTAADNQTSVEIHVLQGERQMAQDNKTLGKFQLTGIPAARRGVPQIEVTFDIDANGILKVSAKDKATGKEQAIRIEASSGLSKEEIEKMKAEAEANAEADKKEREKIDKLNQADSVIFSTENQLKELGDKLPADKKAPIEAALQKLKDAHKAQDLAAIDTAMAEINTAFQAASAEMYAQSGAQGGAQAGPDMNGGAGQQDNSKHGDNVQDADFEEVK